ncbi:unnamed protein product [Rodentolepis nana]|uniref:Polyprotein n=1 Tax=Rodentolepis nana TaxID=102285 RepID=A0A0R3T9F4_RODNA|nr:unnamed protein product [Rodentolepis nana]
MWDLTSDLRSARSYINQLLKNTYTAAVNGLGLNSKSASQPQPLLPLTVSRQGTSGNQSRLMMKSGKPASLLLVALMILASATVLPLPGLESYPEGAAALKTDVAANDQSVLAGLDTESGGSSPFPPVGYIEGMWVECIHSICQGV